MKRIACLAACAAALVALPATAAVAATPKPTTITIVVGKKGVVGGTVKRTLRKGTKVVILVRVSRLAVKMAHLHGYNLEAVPRRGVARIAFTARLKGVFELALHLRSGAELTAAELTVK